MDTIPIEGENQLVRDIYSGAVININDKQRKELQQIRQIKRTEQEKLENMESRLDQLEQTIEKTNQLLTMIARKLDRGK